MQVPVYDRQVVGNQMPTVRIPQNDVRMLNMGGLEQAQQSFGNAVQEDSASLYNQQVKTALQQNMVAVNQAKQQYIEQMNNNAYDPDLGLLNMNGTEAVGVTSAMNQFSKSCAQNIINSNLIGNNNVRKQAFLEEIGPIADSYNKMAMDHEYKQTQIAAKESADASAAAAQNMVVLNSDKTQNVVDDKGQAVIDPNTGKPQQVYLSDAPFRSAINDKVNYDRSIGMPEDAIAQDVKAFATDTITKGVQARLAANDFQGAESFLQRYGNDKSKMDEEPYALLQKSISKAYAPVRSRQIADSIFSSHGLDDEAGALKEIRDTYGNDPDFSMINTTLHADYSDGRTIKEQSDKQKMKAIATQLYSVSDMATAAGIINKLLSDGEIDGQQADQLLSAQKNKINALKPPKGPATEGQTESKWCANYEVNGGLTRDSDTIDDYNTRIANGEDIPASFQKTADVAATRMNRYWKGSSGGRYDPEQADKDSQASQAALQSIYDNIETLAERGYGKDYIEGKVEPILDDLGIDHDTFYDTVEWDKIGKTPGGVQ